MITLPARGFPPADPVSKRSSPDVSVQPSCLFCDQISNSQ
jgi:hypothetical protein